MAEPMRSQGHLHAVWADQRKSLSCFRLADPGQRKAKGILKRVDHFIKGPAGYAEGQLEVLPSPPRQAERFTGRLHPSSHRRMDRDRRGLQDDGDAGGGGKVPRISRQAIGQVDEAVDVDPVRQPEGLLDPGPRPGEAPSERVRRLLPTAPGDHRS